MLTVTRIEHIDMTIAEVAHQQIIAEGSGVRRGKCHSPGRVEATTRNQAAVEISIRVEHIDKPMSNAANVIMLLSILQGERNKQVIPDGLNPEWSVTLMEDATDEGQFPVSERTHQLKVSIKHFDGAKAEIGGIKECSISIRCNSQSFVDSPQTDIGPIHREDGMGRINLWIPARDGAVLCSKKK